MTSTGLFKPNYYYSTNNNAYWSIQADVAENVWDPTFKTVIRIDIPKSDNGVMPSIGGKTFSIEDNPQYEKFPGTFLVFNGEKSTLKKVSQGTITFSPGFNWRPRQRVILMLPWSTMIHHSILRPSIISRGCLISSWGPASKRALFPPDHKPDSRSTAH